MAVKPEWLRRLETEHKSRVVMNNYATELKSSEDQVLNVGVPKLWARIANCLQDALETCEISGITPSFNLASANLITISVCRSHSAVPAAVLDIRLEGYEILPRFRTNIGVDLPKLRFTVAAGRVSLSEGPYPLPDNGEDVAEVASQRLLEPLLRSFLNE